MATATIAVAIGSCANSNYSNGSYSFGNSRYGNGGNGLCWPFHIILLLSVCLCRPCSVPCSTLLLWPCMKGS